MNPSELLEPRRLLSSALSTGILEISGTNHADQIDVTTSGSKIKVDEHNGSSPKYYAAASVKSFVVDLQGGNDVVRFPRSITEPATILGGDGNDTIQPGTGHDSIDGGADSDTLDYSSWSKAVWVQITAGKGGSETGTVGTYHFESNSEDTFQISDNQDTVAGEQSFIGTSGKDYFSVTGDGSKNPNSYLQLTFDGRAGNDTGNIETIDQTFNYFPPIDFIGGAGNDGVDTEFPISMNGGDGDDTFIVNAPFGAGSAASVQAMLNNFHAGPGTDTEGYNAYGFDGTLVMGPDVENFYAPVQGDYEIVGNALNNKIYDANDGNITLQGGAGNDTLQGVGDGTSELIGGTGDDTYLTPSAFDATDGLFNVTDTIVELPNQGNDTITLGASVYPAPSKPFVVNLSATGTNFGGGDGLQLQTQLPGEAGNIENVIGTIYADSITGNSANNYLDGGAGNDTINGAGGNDSIDGDDGDDLLHGGTGGDSIYGDQGNDSLFGDASKDQLYGQEGNDTLNGADGEADTLDGGIGTDTAIRDNSRTIVDSVRAVEKYT